LCLLPHLVTQPVGVLARPRDDALGLAARLGEDPLRIRLQPLEEWPQNYIFPAEAKTVSPEFVRSGTRLAALEMIRSGTTTFADMYYFEEEIARETRAAGLRAVLKNEVPRFSLDYRCGSVNACRWFQLSIDPLQQDGGAVLMQLDITDRKLAEQALQESEARSRGTFEHGERSGEGAPSFVCPIAPEPARSEAAERQRGIHDMRARIVQPQRSSRMPDVPGGSGSPIFHA
jgi:PAS domain-containing protein